jgi:hypothetical protein
MTPSLPGLTRQSIPASQKLFTKAMDARIKSAHDASGASSVRGIPVCTMPSSFPRRVFAPGLLQPLLRSPPNRGEQSAERRSGAAAPGGRALHASQTRVNALMTPHARRLARRLASHDAGRSPLGAPPWRFLAPGPRFSHRHLRRIGHSESPRTQVVVPGGRLPEPPGASGYEPPPQDATPRSAFRIASGDAPQ